tara:strand:+ start:29 stop:280 length:252 start_codon:yes stop_codon:yes gene_type:complete
MSRVTAGARAVRGSLTGVSGLGVAKLGPAPASRATLRCKHTASKQLEDEENGAKECSGREETPRCLRHGTSWAHNSQKEERIC